MRREIITYTDYEGVERTEDFYFNMTETELLEMELSEEGGMQKRLEKIVNSANLKDLIEIFKDFVFRSYGVKSEDGKRFIKSEKLATEFKQTEAYNVLFMRLATDDKAAADFINGIIPKKLAEQVAAQASAPVAASAAI